MAAHKLILELWEEPDGKTMVCHAGPTGDGARALLEPGARLAWAFEAESHFDAMNQYHARMGWPDYQTAEPWDRQPYPPEWITSQCAALAQMMGNRDAIAESASAKAWRAAGEDLGIRFDSPFAMHYKNETYWCAGLLPDFGGPNGTIIACRFAVDDIFDVADAVGFYHSGLNPYFYESYDRALFSETLNDCGWFGDPATAPAWFKGAFGNHGGRP